MWVKSCCDSSPLFTHSSPWFFLRMRDLLLNQASVFGLQWWPASVFNDDQLWSSMMTSFGLQWWPASSARRPGGFEIRRKKGSTYKDRGICNPPIKGKAYPLLRIANPQSLNRLGHFLTPDFKSGGTPSGLVVKSGEEWWRGEPTLHLSEPQCLSGFQTIWWRVKSKSESSLFLSSAIFFSLPPSLTFFRLLSSASSRRVVSCLAMARNCPGKGQYCAIARQYTLRASLTFPDFSRHFFTL